MKRMIFSTLCFFAFCIVQAQIPQAFSFQGVAFNANGNPVADATISVKAEILKDLANGNIEYSEIHTTQTNGNGLYSLSIGFGLPSIGDFESISWASGQKYLSISIDPAGGNNFVAIGVSQLLSVPYALVAGNAVATKPKILVSKNPRYDPVNVITEEINSTNSRIYQLGFLYRWIDGTPETVYIDYKNVPEELGIYNEGGEASNYAGVLTSKTDTIDLGIYQRATYMALSNVNDPIAHGNYDITMVFRTETEILDSVTVRFNFSNDPIQVCRDNLIGVKTLTTVACRDNNENPITDNYLNTLLGTTMELKAAPLPTYLLMLKFLNQKNDSAELLSCTVVDLLSGNISNNDRSMVVDTVKILPNNVLEFDLNVTTFDPAQTYKCTVKYD